MRCKTFNCRPTLVHRKAMWPLKLSLLSICMPNIFIVEVAVITLSLTSIWRSLSFGAFGLISIDWNLLGFASKCGEVSLTSHIGSQQCGIYPVIWRNLHTSDTTTVVSHECHGISSHQQIGCVLNSLWRLTTTVTSKAHNWYFVWETKGHLCWWIHLTKGH